MKWKVNVNSYMQHCRDLHASVHGTRSSSGACIVMVLSQFQSHTITQNARTRLHSTKLCCGQNSIIEIGE